MITKARKTISKTDERKGAYIVTKQQQAILEQAGYMPHHSDDEILIPILNLHTNQVLQCSHYGSERKPDPTRQDEIRLGREIMQLVKGHVGSELWLGIHGDQVVVAHSDPEVILAFPTTADPDQLTRSAQAYAESCDYELDEYEGSEAPPESVARTVCRTKRCPRVRANVLKQANGVCELCGMAGPFESSVDGRPFLEIHHVRQLRDGGLDHTSNAVALCPNCHRRCHFSTDADVATKELYDKIRRLIQRP